MLYKTNNPHGGDIYGERIVLDCSVNVNPFGTPEGVKRAVCNSIEELDRYPDPYCRELIEKIAETENVQKDNILCGNGAAELIFSYFQAVKPKKTAELAPTFSGYSEALEGVDCDIVRYSLSKDNNFDIDEGVFDFLENEKPDVFIVCNPNNPTGRAVEPSFMKKILVYCHKNGIRLFVDECFLELSTNGDGMKGFLSEYENLFILRAFTKNYAMAGLRLGYCLTADKSLLKRMSQRVQPWNVSLLAQKAGVAALSESEFIKIAREYIAEQRIRISDALGELGFWVCPSMANYILFYGKEDLDIELRKKGILIRNCGNYHGLGPGWFRIAVRLQEENEKLINAIKMICER